MSKLSLKGWEVVFSHHSKTEGNELKSPYANIFYDGIPMGLITGFKIGFNEILQKMTMHMEVPIFGDAIKSMTEEDLATELALIRVSEAAKPLLEWLNSHKNNMSSVPTQVQLPSTPLKPGETWKPFENPSMETLPPPEAPLTGKKS